MDIPRTVRKELDALSKEVFGASSRWKRFVEGVMEPLTKTIVEVVPGENGAPDTTKETKVLDTIRGVKQSVIKRYTLEETKKILLGMKAQKDAYIAKMKEQEELKKVQERIQDQAAGKSTEQG